MCKCVMRCIALVTHGSSSCKRLFLFKIFFLCEPSLESLLTLLQYCFFFFKWRTFLFVFWLHCVFIALHGLSLVVAIWVTFGCGVGASCCSGFSFGAQAVDT